MKCVHETEHGFCEIDNDFCHNGLCRIKEPQTNADRIRAMSDEELARFVTREDLCALTCGEPCIPCDGACERKMLEWLKAEASE